jgi:tRNA nucleotidyltransferase (CCA-adding enzyme)
MDLILCHTTADFDTLGAAVGLTRLHPGARIVLAGGAHPAVRDFLALHRDEYALIERRSVNPEKIRVLMVVDTQRRDRLGKVAEWLDLPNVEIVVYDHHPSGDRDIPATQVCVEAVGATSTLIVEDLRVQQIVPTPMEATVMALGVHVDTGSLTFDHATARDARALAWLMEQGASLRAIAEYTDPALSPKLQQIFTTALENLQTQEVQGYAIAWVLLPLEEFTPGLSSVASRLLDLSEIDALLLGAQYCRGTACRQDDALGDDTLTVIGRSRIEGTDLNQLFKPYGGGGHPRAASLNLHDVSPQDTLAQLVAQLQDQIPHPPSARELMSSPVRTIRPETTIDEAQRILLRYGHSGLSVVDAGGQLVGVISRRDIDIALHHGFSHAPVKGYMTSNLKTIHPDTLLPEIESLMVTYDIGRLPVLEQGQLVGIVTRTDVLRQLHQTGGRQKAEGRRQKAEGRNGEVAGSRLPNSLLAPLQKRLQPALWQVLETAAQQAEQRGWQLYLVGGAVRDLLLALYQNGGNPDRNLLIDDVDLVVDGFHRTAAVGAGVELARSLCTAYPAARLEVHGKFQTAALLWHNDPILDSLWVDIATSRTEFYPYPAANPEVEASSIRQDLYRRDFTINALAIRLTPPHAGELLDFFGGWLDLQERQIRVLHANSFIEDPTRIYRAVRFAVRLGFQIDAQTEGYIRTAIASGIYQQIQAELSRAPALQTRLHAELKYILQSPYWKSALHLLADLDALQCIHPSLQATPFLWRELRLAARILRESRSGRQKAEGKRQKTESEGTDLRGFQKLLGLENPPPLSPSSPPPLSSPPWLLLLEVLLGHIAPEHRDRVAENLQLPAESIARLRQLAQVEWAISSQLPQHQHPSQIVHLLKQYDLPLLILVAVRSPRTIRRQIWQYFTGWSTIKPPIDGNDLKALGYKPGPRFRQILDALTAATLDGVIYSRRDAEAFLSQQFPKE